MKRTGTIAVLLLLPSLVEAQKIGHALFLGLNSSSTYVGDPQFENWLWSGSEEYRRGGGGRHRWGGSVGYGMEYSLSRTISVGLAAEHTRTTSSLYHYCNCIRQIGPGPRYENTVTIDNFSLPFSLKMRMGRRAEGYYYFTGGVGIDLILRAHRETERRVDTIGGDVFQAVVNEGTFVQRNADRNTIGFHYRIGAGKHFRLKEGLALLLEVGFRKNMNEWIYPSVDGLDTVGEYQFKRQWGLFDAGCGILIL